MQSDRHSPKQIVKQEDGGNEPSFADKKNDNKDLLSAALDQSGLMFGGMAQGMPGYSGAYPNNVLNMSAAHAMMQMGARFDHYVQKYMSDPRDMMAGQQQSLAALHQMYSGISNQESAGQMGQAAPLSNRDIGKLWMNNEMKMKGLPTRNVDDTTGVEEAVEEEEDELGHQETYAEYMPSKLKVGQRHPDPVVETSSLSSVQPPEVWYDLSIPEDAIDNCKLSALQLEAIVYASQQHDCFLPDSTRAGYLVGDGAGVGKGRTIAGIIYENYLMGRKRALWLSVSNDLKYDAERDLKDIGASKIDVHLLSKFKYAKISSKINGSVKKGVIFSTYSSLIGESQSGGKYRTRLKQLLHWCGEDFDGVIVFDECHKAKNLCPVGSTKPTKTGLTVLELQNKLPKARVVYASATGASEPKNMAYMTRLGIWGEGTPFPEFSDFISAVEKRGVGAMEVVAMDMKLRGMYIARQLSFSGVTFKIEELPLNEDFIRMYDESVQLWVDARDKFHLALEIMTSDKRLAKTMWGQFWSSHQRFFKYLCIAAKVPHVVRITREAIKDSKCVVIGLQSTGEARTLEQLEEAGGELTDFVSTAKGVFQSLIDKHFPAPNRTKMFKILGIEKVMSESRSSSASPIPEAGSSSSSSRRNTVLGKRTAARRANEKSKKYRESSDSDSEKNEDNESDFMLSDSNGEENESESASSVKSSSSENEDYNPFGEFSDSDDDDPWLKRMKKSKSKAKKAKKQASNKKIINGKGYTYEPPPPAPVVEPTMDAVERASAMKMELIERLEKLSDSLPPNTLDQLIDDLGGPENVAEMTGRKGRVVSTEDGNIQYESRSELDVPLETLNLTEKKRFMDGDKTIAVISEAASSGISLHADRRVPNRARRVHITLELPWSADRAIQQFGRSHRSNQVNAPEYIFLISDLAGERRFASSVAKRLESLGALTHGDRRATETRDLSRFNIDNKYGRAALEVVMRSLTDMDIPLVKPPSDYVGDFFQDARVALVGVGLITYSADFNVYTLDKDYNNMSKFLNRILGVKVKLQNALFKYFTDTLEAVIFQAKRTGKWDMGILDLGTDGDTVKRVECRTFLNKHATGVAKTELNTITVERGISWSEAMEVWAELVGKEEGFYLSHQVRNDKKTAILAVQHVVRKKDSPHKKDKLYRVYRPNTGLQVKMESRGDLLKKYAKVSSPDEVQPHWQQQYEASVKTCSHAYWNGTCKRQLVGLLCDVGLRQRNYNILSGSVLNMWTKVESVLSSVPGSQNSKMQIMRVKTDQGKIVGVSIPNSCMEPLIKMMSEQSSKMDVQKF